MLDPHPRSFLAFGVACLRAAEEEEVTFPDWLPSRSPEEQIQHPELVRHATRSEGLKRVARTLSATDLATALGVAEDDIPVALLDTHASALEYGLRKAAQVDALRAEMAGQARRAPTTKQADRKRIALVLAGLFLGPAAFNQSRAAAMAREGVPRSEANRGAAQHHHVRDALKSYSGPITRYSLDHAHLASLALATTASSNYRLIRNGWRSLRTLPGYSAARHETYVERCRTSGQLAEWMLAFNALDAENLSAGSVGTSKAIERAACWLLEEITITQIKAIRAEAERRGADVSEPAFAPMKRNSYWRTLKALQLDATHASEN